MNDADGEIYFCLHDNRRLHPQRSRNIDSHSGKRGGDVLHFLGREFLAAFDVHDDGAMRWLRACLWPSDRVRSERLMAAAALAREANCT